MREVLSGAWVSCVWEMEGSGETGSFAAPFLRKRMAQTVIKIRRAMRRSRLMKSLGLTEQMNIPYFLLLENNLWF